MIRKGTWIVLVLFIILLGLAFYLNKYPITSSANVTPSPTEVPQVFDGWVSSDITSIEYKGDKGVLTLTRNPDGSWNIGPEDTADASIGQAEVLLSQLLTLDVQSILDTNNPLDAVGLAVPSQSITIRNKQGKQVILNIGKQTPTGSGYYVQVDRSAPVVVNKSTLDAVLDMMTREKLASPTPTVITTPGTEATATAEESSLP